MITVAVYRRQWLQICLAEQQWPELIPQDITTEWHKRKSDCVFGSYSVLSVLVTHTRRHTGMLNWKNAGWYGLVADCMLHDHASSLNIIGLWM